MKTHTILLIVGVALMALGGSAIDRRLGLTGWHMEVGIFALGLIFIAQSAVKKLEVRVRQLEAELRSLRPPPVPPAPQAGQ